MERGSARPRSNALWSRAAPQGPRPTRRTPPTPPGSSPRGGVVINGTDECDVEIARVYCARTLLLLDDKRSSPRHRRPRSLWTSGRSTRSAVPHACLRQRLQQPVPASPSLARIVRCDNTLAIADDRCFQPIVCEEPASARADAFLPSARWRAGAG